MLIGFKSSNYKSLRDEQELSMLPSRSGGRFTALPVAAIYGANASGKSILIEALSFKDRLTRLHPERPGLFKPFLLDKASADRPTSYEIEAEIDGVRYEYQLSVSSHGVEGEQLHSYPQQRRRTLLDRTGETITIGASVTNRAALQALSTETPTDTPALSMADSYKATEWQPFWRWLREGLVTRPMRQPLENLPDAIERHPVLIALAKVADLGITDMRVTTTTLDITSEYSPLPDFSNEERAQLTHFLWEHLARERQTTADAGRQMLFGLRHVQFYHQSGSRPLTEFDQSSGTITFLKYMASVLDALQDGATLVIDEFDTSLHPRIIPRIIELFQAPRTNPRNAQLIFSTHDASLLGTSFGEPILKRDEVWFVEKQDDGASELYPLTSFKPRKEHNLERHYLGGSYGAVPDVYPASLVDIVAAANEVE